MTYPIFQYGLKLHLYQVVDDDGRSLDIRTWPKDIWDYAPAHVSYCCEVTERKCHVHRVNGPSMRHRTMEAAAEMVDWGEVELLGLPMRDESTIRKKFLPSKTDLYRRRVNANSRCWKNHGKSARQFAKHKKAVNKHNLSNKKGKTLNETFFNLAADRFPVDMETLADQDSYCW